MTPDENIHNILLATDAVTALIGDRVVPVEQAAESAFPNIAIEITGDVPTKRLRGPGDHTSFTVDVKIRGIKYKSVRDVCAAVKAVLNYYHDDEMPLAEYQGGQAQDDDRSFQYVQTYECQCKN